MLDSSIMSSLQNIFLHLQRDMTIAGACICHYTISKLLPVQVPNNKVGELRDEQQANSSNASGVKQSHNLGAAETSTVDLKPASSQVKAEPQADGVSSQSADQKQLDSKDVLVKAATLVPAKAEQTGAGSDAAALDVKVETDGPNAPESGEISNAAAVAGQGLNGLTAQDGVGLTVKVDVGLKEDEAVGNSPDATPQLLRIRDRCVPRHLCTV